MSRFSNTFLVSTRNRAGYTAPVIARLGGLATQFSCNLNVTADAKGQAWANFAEAGPGFRFRWNAMPRSLVFSLDLLKGHYLLDGRGGYTDVRAGIWYAFTR